MPKDKNELFEFLDYAQKQCYLAFLVKPERKEIKELKRLENELNFYTLESLEEYPQDSGFICRDVELYSVLEDSPIVLMGNFTYSDWEDNKYYFSILFENNKQKTLNNLRSYLEHSPQKLNSGRIEIAMANMDKILDLLFVDQKEKLAEYCNLQQKVCSRGKKVFDISKKVNKNLEQFLNRLYCGNDSLLQIPYLVLRSDKYTSIERAFYIFKKELEFYSLPHKDTNQEHKIWFKENDYTEEDPLINWSRVVVKYLYNSMF